MAHMSAHPQMREHERDTTASSRGREWYSVEGIVFDRHGGREVDGHPLASAAWLSVLNPAAEEAQATLVIYHERREPSEHHFTAPAGLTPMCSPVASW